MEQVEEEQRKNVEFGERQGKKLRSFEQGGAQYKGGRDNVKWPKNKWESFGFFSAGCAPYSIFLGDRLH